MWIIGEDGKDAYFKRSDAEAARTMSALRAVKPSDISDEQIRVFFRVMEGDKRLGEDFNARGRRAIAASMNAAAIAAGASHD